MLSDFTDKRRFLATARASLWARWIGLAALGSLGLFLIYVAFTSSARFGWQVFLLAMGAGPLDGRQNAPRQPLVQFELTPNRIARHRRYSGSRGSRILSAGSRRVAFKPSNGFLLADQGRHWRATGSGVWSMVAHRRRVWHWPGMTPPAIQDQFMSEIIFRDDGRAPLEIEKARRQIAAGLFSLLCCGFTPRLNRAPKGHAAGGVKTKSLPLAPVSPMV